ncbi:MAG: DUF1570 domain-containing protein [Sphingomicrobium sp.]
MNKLLAAVGAALLVSTAGSAPAAWHEAKSKHFIIYADADEQWLRDYAERLERFDKAVRRVRAMDDPELSDSRKLAVYTLPNSSAVARLAKSDEVLGFFKPKVSGALAFVPRSTFSGGRRSSMDPETVFFHEYAHYLQAQEANRAWPAWLREGFAEFFSSAEVAKDGGVELGLPQDARARTILGHFTLSLEDLLGGASRRTLSDKQTDELYAQGWLLTHYLAFEQSRKGQIARYVTSIGEGHPPVDAARTAFGDLKALDRELDRYKRGKMPSLTIEARVIPIAPVEVRQMTLGEAAIMKVRVRLKHGNNTQTAPDVAADARKVAAAYPSDPFVLATLAEAEIGARNLAAAEAAADRLLTLNPKHVQGLIFKGRSRMELARRVGPSADWKEARSWFLRANAADNDNAEALVLFYNGFVGAGEEPPKNAVDGLLFAVELVPQDPAIRMEAVRRLLRGKRPSEAREMFAPIAFSPHASAAARAKGASIMGLMTAGDSNGAFALLMGASQ